jgi:hypothetical protein
MFPCVKSSTLGDWFYVSSVNTGQNTDKIHQQKPLIIYAWEQRSTTRQQGTVSLITVTRDDVLASPITLGPGLGEEVNAAGRDLAEATMPLAEAVAQAL